MSLINEALKKAQRLRTEETTDSSSAVSYTGTHPAKRSQAHAGNTMVLIGSGALVLIVLSVVFTVYLVNRPAKPAHSVATTPAPKASSESPSPAASESSAPAIVAPKIIAPTTTTAATEPLAPSSTSPAVTASSPTPPVVASAVPATATPLAAVTPSAPPQPAPAPTAETSAATTGPSAAPTLAPGEPDERVAAFVDAVRVTGIRSSGAESRVLMNERVYRVNDVVERNLGVRLIKAEVDSLTFSDGRGVTYVKHF
jgi:hypothetical protein